MEDIIENATIIYKNGIKKICETISITDKGVYIGYFKLINGGEKEFVNYSFIPKDKIQKILFFNEDGSPKDIDFGKN